MQTFCGAAEAPAVLGEWSGRTDKAAELSLGATELVLVAVAEGGELRGMDVGC